MNVIDPEFREIGNTVLSKNAHEHYKRHLARGCSEDVAIRLAQTVDRQDDLF